MAEIASGAAAPVDEGVASAPQAGQAPPPPPPPPVTGMWGTSTHPAGDMTPATSLRLSSADGSSSPRGKVKELRTLTEEVLRIIKSERLELGEKCMLLSRHKVLTSILQDGPMCGLVALAMCSQMLKRDLVSSDSLLDYAKHKSFTLQGEMFSASEMVDVAEQLVKCRCQVLVMDSPSSLRALISHLVKGNPVLLPYDADANHQPCLKQGHRAHWAAVSGLLIIRNSAVTDDLYSVLQPDKEVSGLYHIFTEEEFVAEASTQDVTSYRQVIDNVIEVAESNPNLVYLYCKQGKSKFTRLYPLVKLLESNRNLKQIDPKITQNIQDFVIPEEGIKGICSKIILLEKTCSQ